MTAATTPLSDADVIYVAQSSGAVDRKCSPLDIAKRALDTEGLAETGGTVITSKNLGTQSSGTLTIEVSGRKLQHYTNGGAHVLTATGSTGFCFIDITNNGSAGAINTSAFTHVSGDSFTTGNGDKFHCVLVVGNVGSTLEVIAI